MTTNDKTIKLWKISEKSIRKVIPPKKENPNKIVFPQLQTVESGLIPRLKKKYPNLHNYHINSISPSSNCENFISSDDLRIYLWNFERTKEAFNIIDLKPDNLEELSEVITSSTYHPTASNLLIYSTSKGLIKVCDLRKSSISDNTALTFQEDLSHVKKNLFTEIISSVSDARFTTDGKNIISRDFLNVKVWDIRNSAKPTITIPLFNPLKSKLCELYENEAIFDKFNIASSPCSNYFITGMFNSNFHVVDTMGE